MTSFTPTPEQLDIIEFCKSSDDNLIIQALAGAAKTSTLVLIANALKSKPILCLAFNKKIAVEMTDRLPGNCTSMTLNSIGHRTWAQATGKRLIVDTRKSANILRSFVDELPKNKADEAWDEFAETLNIVRAAKSMGYMPDKHYEQAARLYSDADFFADLERAPTALQEELAVRTIVASTKQAFDGRIDFDDQIYMPALFPVSFPQFPLVMIDEAQDLSDLNHVCLRKMARKRLIAVGDPCQAIYGFRGANESSMQEMRTAFDMHPMKLTISFRCPRAVVEEAQWRAPEMRYPDWAKEGVVERWHSWDVHRIPENAAIICRNNAPLFSMAVKLLSNGRPPKLLGNDFTAGLTKKMKKLGDLGMDKADTLAAIDKWETGELHRARNTARIVDLAECFRIFARNAENLGGAIANAEHVMSSEGPIQLMTGHKSKGLEFDDVIFLDQKLVREEGQDINLRYVIQTRAKHRLIYAESDNFEDDFGGED